MKRKQGRLIVMDGIDGSGKGTQINLLARHLRKEGKTVKIIRFPQYHKRSSTFVQRFLHGKYGQTDDVSPYARALFYALDRFDASPEIRQKIDQGYIVLIDRYVTANMGHQGTAFKTRKARRDFFHWIAQLEYDRLGIPRPDQTLITSLPAAIAYQWIAKKSKRAYLRGKKRDINERNHKHLEQANRVFHELPTVFPKMSLIRLTEGERLLTPSEVHAKVWKVIHPLL